MSNIAEFTLFADDATLIFSDRDSDVLTDRVNSDLSLVHEWTLNNRLMLNANKTSAILFTNRTANVANTRFKINNETLICVEQIK